MSDDFYNLLDVLSNQLKMLNLFEQASSRKEGTALIRRAIEEIAKNYGWECEREVLVGIKKDGRRGFCDLTLRKPAEKNIIIEIDSSNKKWSLMKLMEAYQSGNEVIWIRWNCPMKFEVPGYVNLIDLNK